MLNFWRLFIQACKWFAASCGFLRLLVGRLKRSVRLLWVGEILGCSSNRGSVESNCDKAWRDILDICHSSSGSLPSLILIHIIWMSCMLRGRIRHERLISMATLSFFIEMQLHSNSFNIIKLLIQVPRRVVKKAQLCLRFSIHVCLLHEIVEVLLILLLMLLKLMGLTLELSDLGTHRWLKAAGTALNTLALMTAFWARALLVIGEALLVDWWYGLLGKHSRVISIPKELSVFKVMREKLFVISCSDITWSTALHILIQELLKLRILLDIVLVVHDCWFWEIVVANFDEPIWRYHGITTFFCVLSLTNLLHIIILLLFLNKSFTPMNALKIISIIKIGCAFENGFI